MISEYRFLYASKASMPRRLYFGGTFSENGDLNILLLFLPRRHTRFSFVRSVILYHLQNGHLKNEISLGGTTEIYKCYGMFRILRGTIFYFKAVNLPKLLIFAGS